MTNQLSGKQMIDLLEALVSAPYWHGETNADNDALDAVGTWGLIASVAINKLTDALYSATRAPHENYSAEEIREAVREQLECIHEGLGDQA
ncbi:hypothetical protein [Lacticaseibacillus salsurivasis]|uniref:hypothetical protein n=1 Tax=Lacticaseibacillus salsurivasis TaxID=3081441 RepID=UPI0030C6C617